MKPMDGENDAPFVSLTKEQEDALERNHQDALSELELLVADVGTLIRDAGMAISSASEIPAPLTEALRMAEVTIPERIRAYDFERAAYRWAYGRRPATEFDIHALAVAYAKGEFRQKVG
jgi:hypothetical protein